MTNLSDIIERLEKAEAGSRELDCWIGYIADLREDDMSWRDKIDRYGINHAITSAESRTNVWSTVLPRYTTSVDAAISLAGKVLPECQWTIDSTGPCTASIWTFEDEAWRSGEETYQVEGRTPPIALCIAILTALKAKAQQQEGGE